MIIDNKDFLMELLNTASPSSQEMGIQKKWIKYVKPFADEIKTDNAGNAIGVLNPDAKFKVLLAGHCDEIGLVINRIDDDGFLHFEKGAMLLLSFPQNILPLLFPGHWSSFP